LRRAALLGDDWQAALRQETEAEPAVNVLQAAGSAASKPAMDQ
jgi:hypothetical protein